MGDDGVAHLLPRQVTQHRHLNAGDDLAGLGADNGGAQDEVGAGVDDDLEEALGVAQGLGARHGRRRSLGDAHLVAGLAGLGLAHAHVPELGRGEDGPRDEASGGGGLLAGEEVAQDAEVVPGGVGELGRSGHVTGGVDVLGGGTQVVVDAHEAALGQLHAGGLQTETGGDGGAPQGDEQVGSAHLVPVGSGDDDAVPVSRGGDLRGTRSGQDRDSQGLQAGGHLSGDVLVLAVQDVRPSVDNGDRDTEEPHEGGHLDTDDPAAQDDEATGQLGQGKQVLAGPVAHVGQALDRGDRRRGTGVDEDLGAAHAPQAAVVQGDLDGALPHEAGGALDEVHAGGGEHLLVSGHHAAHDGLLAGAEGGQLDAGLGQGVGAAVLFGQGDAVGL